MKQEPIESKLTHTILEYEARIQAVFDAAVDAIVTINDQGIIQSINQATKKLFGYIDVELLGRNVTMLMPEPFAADHDGFLKNYLHSGIKKVIGIGREVFARKKDGTIFPIELAIGESITGSRHRFVGFIRDISKRKAALEEKHELEARFLRAQRLESIGTLVSGIAHDLNNVMTPVLMAIKLLRKDKPGLKKMELLETAQASIERGTEMIRQLLTFSGGVSVHKTPVNLINLMGELLKLLRHSFPKSIELKSVFPDKPAMVNADATQLLQVVMNLCVNARDAMPDGGTLTISLGKINLTQEVVERYPGAAPCSYVYIAVSDSGSGISPDVQEKMFDPFYTTKPFGKGTGLGLSTVLGIVKTHQGFINVYSEIGIGTKISIYLPALSHHAEMSSEDSSEVLSKSGNNERILLVDDESAILVTAKTTLQSHGYQVLATTSGEEAIHHFLARKIEFKLVVVDLMMPKVDGYAVISAIRKVDMSIPLIATSGLTPSGDNLQKLKDQKVLFIAKPYSDDSLLEEIASLIPAN